SGCTYSGRAGHERPRAPPWADLRNRPRDPRVGQRTAAARPRDQGVQGVAGNRLRRPGPRAADARGAARGERRPPVGRGPARALADVARPDEARSLELRRLADTDAALPR